MAAVPAEDDVNQDDDVAEGKSDCILALVMMRQSVGVAVYDGHHSAMYSTQLTTLTTLGERLEEISLAVKPRLVLTNMATANNEGFVALVTDGGSVDHSVTKSSEWDYSASKLRIVEHLYVRDLMESGKASSSSRAEDGGAAAHSVIYDNYQLLSSEFDFSDKTRVCALGGLVSYLQKEVFTMEQHGHVHVRSLSSMESLVSGHCVIDPVSLRALSIFVEDFHPSQVKGKGRSKEGFSVFGVFDRTSSTGGRRCLREWFRSPLADVAKISRRQDGVALFTLPEFKEIESEIVRHMKKVQDTPQVLLRIKKVQSSYRDWVALSGTFEALWSVVDHLRVLHSRCHTEASTAWLESVLERCDTDTLHRCYRLIAESIDVDMSKHSKQTCIREGYNPALDDLRAKWDDVERVLEEAARLTLEDLPELATVRAEFIAHIGYHIVINQADEQYLGQGGGNGTLEFMFAQEGMLYMKNALMRRYDAEVGDVPSQYHDLVKEILRSLEEDVLANEVDLNSLSAAVSEVDATIALARVAVEYDFVRPKVVESEVVLIKGGRHPLQQLVVNTYIPNDVALGHNGVKAAVITGPNFSGKSVYLKQVGVLVFLAHVGSFIPCEDAIIGVVDRIFTRIESLETCTVPQSTFTLDLNQMATMLRRCSSKSLLLVDEFGKGTSPADGMALLAAMVDSIIADPNPRMVVTTHFLELFEFGLMGADCDAGLLKFRMDYILPSDAASSGAAGAAERTGDDTNDTASEDLVPLFKLVPGVATSSDGLACAKLGGLPAPLLARAHEVMGLLEQGKPIHPAASVNQGGGGAIGVGPGSVGHDLLTLFLESPAFTDADDAALATFKSLVHAL